MDAITLAQSVLASNKSMLFMLLADLTDADLLVRPVPGANHFAWQLGHLILAEQRLAGNFPGEPSYPDLPADFLDRHGKEAAAKDSGFCTKDEYQRLFEATRDRTIVLVSKLTAADLDKPTTGGVARLAPNLGCLLILLTNHTMMHAGQLSVVRRRLGKPVLF